MTTGKRFEREETERTGEMGEMPIADGTLPVVNGDGRQWATQARHKMEAPKGPFAARTVVQVPGSWRIVERWQVCGHRHRAHAGSAQGPSELTLMNTEMNTKGHKRTQRDTIGHNRTQMDTLWESRGTRVHRTSKERL